MIILSNRQKKGQVKGLNVVHHFKFIQQFLLYFADFHDFTPFAREAAKKLNVICLSFIIQKKFFLEARLLRGEEGVKSRATKKK